MLWMRFSARRHTPIKLATKKLNTRDLQAKNEEIK
jgi:hypothetical protein